jgi:hypothetical protein
MLWKVVYLFSGLGQLSENRGRNTADVVPDNDGSSRPTGSGLLLLYREEATAPPALELRFLLLLYSVHCSDKETGALYQSPVQTMKRVRTRHTTTLEARSIHGESVNRVTVITTDRAKRRHKQKATWCVCARARG